MSRQALEEAVMIVARRHAYHPLRERVLALRGTWDRQPRLDRWLERVCLEEDEHEADLQEYLRLAGRFFLMAMVARVLPEVRRGGDVVIGPGCKFDYMLILEGPQGMGKSTFARILGGDYFADTGLDIQHKDSLMNIQGVWVYEWSELESLTKQEVGAVKRFISSCEDRFRATFDRRPAKYPRQVVFIGTTNEAHYLTDTTGNRRFWPLRVTRPLDTDWLRENVEQLLAEALHYVDAGERFFPGRAEQARYFDPQQRERTVESSIEAAIRTYLYDPHQKVQMGDPNGSLVDEIGMTELLCRIGYSVDKQTDAVVKRAGSVLNALGWTTRRLSADDEGRRPRVYVRPKETRGRARASQSTGVTQPHSETEALDAPPF
jgi:predicted P-loop ATPase